MRRDLADGAVQAGVVIPVDPFQGFPFDLTNGLPGVEELDDLGLEQADDAFGEGVVVGIPDAADGGIDAGFGEPVGVSDRQVLAASITVMDQFVSLGRHPLTDGLVQGIQDETGCHRGRDTPANDLAGENVDDEGHVDHALPARDIGEVADPKLVRYVRHEGSVYLVVRARLCRIGVSGDHLLASHNAL